MLRMHHRAAVDPAPGVMYIYGGVKLRAKDGSRLPADCTAGTVYAYNFSKWEWTILATTGGPSYGVCCVAC